MNRPLLRNANDDDDDNDADDEKCHNETILLNDNGERKRYKKHRHQFPRRVIKLLRLLLLSFAIIISLFVIYSPIFNMDRSRTTPLVGWSYNISRKLNDYIIPNVDTALIQPRSVCLHKFFLLVVVTSSVNNFDARQLIRETWGNVTEFNYPMFAKIHSHMTGKYLDIRQHNVLLHSDYLNLPNITENFTESIRNVNFPVHVVFMLGKNNNSNINNSSNYNKTIALLKLESERYDDIIQENFIDTYNNLTIKSAMMLKWIQRKCTNRMKFIIKCDDDTFLNIPNILHILLGGTIPIYNDTAEFYDKHTINALSPSNRMLITQNLLTGYLFCKVKPVEWVTSKWYAPIYMFNETIYPNYISGSSYLMSYDVVNKLYKSALNTTILHLEDVFLTGIVADKIGLKRRHNGLFSFTENQNLCSYKGTITQHYLTKSRMLNVYKFLQKFNEKCPPPNKFFKVRGLRPKSCL